MKHTSSPRTRFAFIFIAVSLCLTGLSYSIGAVSAASTAKIANSCYASHNGTIFSSSDASALQAAVDAAGPDDLVRISGTCNGVQTRFGVTQTVYLSQSITLEGGWNATFDSFDPATQITTIDAEDGGRVVTIGPLLTVGISHLTLQNGSARDLGRNVQDDVDSGGGVLVLTDTVAHLDQVIINSNFADAGSGLYANESTITLSNSQMQNNLGAYTFQSVGAANTILTTEIVSNTAGGIFTFGGTLDVKQSEIASNTIFFGAGMHIANTVAEISHSTIANNKSDGIAAGIHVRTQSVVTMSNSTISSNSSANQGAALHLLGSDTIATLIHVTIADNSAVSATVFMGADTTISLANSIIDSGAGTACETELITQTITLIGANLATDASCGASITGDPMLADLGDNGGVALRSGNASRTHALSVNSSAQDEASGAACAADPISLKDQRGSNRASACDLGAYDDNSSSVPTTIQLGTQAAHAPISELGTLFILLGMLALCTLLYLLPKRIR